MEKPIVNASEVALPTRWDWVLGAASVGLLLVLQFEAWGRAVLLWSIVCLISCIVRPESHSTLASRQTCAGITLGFAWMWAGVLFIGWKELPPVQLDLDNTARQITTGFPIPGIRRIGWETPEPLPGANPVAGSVPSFRCFELDRDWLILIVNSMLLGIAGVLLCRRVRGRRLRWIHGIGGVTAAVLGVAGAFYLTENIAFSVVDGAR